jgi:hypothetical protein
MAVKMNSEEAKGFVDLIYRQVAEPLAAAGQQLAIHESSGCGKASQGDFPAVFSRTGRRTPLKSTPSKRLHITNISTSSVSIVI